MNTLAAILIIASGLVVIQASDESFYATLNKTNKFFQTSCNSSTISLYKSEAACNKTFNGERFYKPLADPVCEALKDIDVCLKFLCNSIEAIDKTIHDSIHALCCGPHLRGALTLVILSTALVYFIRSNIFGSE